MVTNTRPHLALTTQQHEPHTMQRRRTYEARLTVISCRSQALNQTQYHTLRAPVSVTSDTRRVLSPFTVHMLQNVADERMC